MDKSNLIYTGTWGDQGNGTFRNPILNADYSDPDVIRVDDTFYMVCSDFHFMGMQVLKSKDLVNWNYISQIYSGLDINENYVSMNRYGGGSWAPSIRYHNGTFYVYFCTPDEGLFMSSAKSPEGPWEQLHQLVNIKGWEDPCPFWDDDGNAYLGHSILGAGPIILHKMSPDGKCILDEGVEIYRGPVAEGTKFLKLNRYYYLIIPEGGVAAGWQTVCRSGSIYGPYEAKKVLKEGNGINGPHQGGIVDTLSGEWWLLHFQDRGTIGRVVHLNPVKWVDGWPLIGVDIDDDGIGEPVIVHRKPDTGFEHDKIVAPVTSDDFKSERLGLQWQWNHNPVNSSWSLTKRAGFLSLQPVDENTDVLLTRNVLTQKIMGDRGRIITLLDTGNIADGQQAGLTLIGKSAQWIGIKKIDGMDRVIASIDGGFIIGPCIAENKIWLLADIYINNFCSFKYSFDNKAFISLGRGFGCSNANWKGARVGIFTNGTLAGSADFEFFTYLHDGPGGGFKE